MSRDVTLLGPIIAPIANPLQPGTGEIAFLLRNDVLKQIATPAPSNVSTNGYRRPGAEINHTLLAFRCNRKATPSKVDLFNANDRDFSDATAGRIKNLEECPVSRIVGRGDQLLHLRLSKRSGQLTYRSASLQESGRNAVNNSPQIEEVKKAAQRSQLVKYVAVRPSRWECLGEEVCDAHWGNVS